MCDTTKNENLKVPADLNTSGTEEWKSVQLDACIVPLIKALQKAGIDMRGSCCGHNTKEGHIHLQDGRALLVLSKQQADWYFTEGIPLIKDKQDYQ